MFSGAKHTLLAQRASLKDETVELLERLKSRFRPGIFTEEDLHTIVNTVEEGSAESLEF